MYEFMKYRIYSSLEFNVRLELEFSTFSTLIRIDENLYAPPAITGIIYSVLRYIWIYFLNKLAFLRVLKLFCPRPFEPEITYSTTFQKKT